MVSDNLPTYVERVLDGLPFTVWATVGGIALTIVLSSVAGIALLSRYRLPRVLARIYVESLRGSSEVVQLFFFAVALPIFLGVSLGATDRGLLVIGILVLGLNHGAYGAEIVRGAIRSVPAGQVEAAIAVNLSPRQRLWRIVLPQAVVEMLPSFNNLFIQLLKGTALLSFIAVPEIFKKADELRAVPAFSRELGLIYLVELVAYLLIAAVITVVMRALEQIAARRAGRPARWGHQTAPAGLET
ncbi:amino acid ABC transporter permease [Nocardia rhizosphaerihabitans]|uniref:Ectoine/hydroxyectoine ABC transporter permease subunit EhuC n=1 Tax=Nocardia rhizosphaerihabitans TaxID=1691570 RepID=A0ABQ2L3D3_9NOCA|nr:amino acid ABC transporter permease [Nocardia rhizosphaerihabitans]GGN99315.1 ectoine/hydroxyectoine ABC transporter permease subunit EhuC [Nocardia rhizosphaerihabitans]